MLPMVHSSKQISHQIESLLTYLEECQNIDGSYEAQFYFPSQPQKGWIRWGDTAYDTATILLAILPVKTEKATKIIEKGNNFLLKESLHKKLWRFCSGQGYDPLPYDSDATAICSFVLNSSGYKLNNKKLLNCFIDNDHNYKTWIIPKFPNKHLSLNTFIRVSYGNSKALLFNKLNISIDDREFAMNCNILLYTGKTPKNQAVWDKIKNDFKNDKIECRYYNRFYSIYTYARLFGLGVHQELFISRSLVLERINYLYRQLNPKIFSLNHVFLTNTILFFKINLYKDLAETCFSHIATGNYKNPAPYYSSNLIFDKHPDKAEPVNVFGSASLNTSLYIEFLHLYLQRLKT
jgi:hypothetical protein